MNTSTALFIAFLAFLAWLCADLAISTFNGPLTLVNQCACIACVIGFVACVVLMAVVANDDDDSAKP